MEFSTYFSEGDTPLHLAIRENKPELFNLLLKDSNNLNARNQLNQVPLHFAALYNRSEFAKTLIENGATVEEKDGEGKTPLYAALESGNDQVAEVLFQHGAVLSDDDLTDMGPLRNAIKRYNFKMAKLLMANGCNKVDIPKVDGSALELAVSLCRVDLIEYLMKNGEKSSATINKDELDLFGTSSKLREVDVFKYLVDLGLKTEALDILFLNIIYWSHLEIWEYLIKVVSKINADTYFKEKQLHSLVRAGQHEAIKAILNEPTNEYESDPFAKKLAVYIAAETGNEEILETLLNAGYPFDSFFDVITPLHVAATFEHPRLVNLLLKAGADINLQTDSGLTPLHFAATSAQPAVVKFLLQNGADPSKTCFFRGSPLSMSINMFSLLSWGTNIFPSTYEKLEKITKILIPHLKRKKYKNLFLDAIKIRVACSNEKTDLNSISALLSEDIEFDFRSEIVKCIFNYLNDEETKLYTEEAFKPNDFLDHRPELLELMMEYNDSKSCFDLEILDYEISDRSQVLIIGYSKNVDDLLRFSPDYFYYSSRDENDDIRRCFKLVVARLIILTKECHPGVLEFCRKNNLNDWRIECLRQKLLMQKTKINIDLTVTFYDVLTRPVNKLAMFANNKNFVNAIDYSQIEFPAYAEFIKINVELAESRKNFITECVCLMFSVIKQNHKIRISNADIYQIFQYLSVVDLRRFSSACS